MTLTLDDCLRRTAATLDEIQAQKLEESIANMIGDGASDADIEAFQEVSEENFKLWRAHALALAYLQRRRLV